MRIAINSRLLIPGKLDGIGWFTAETVSRIVASHPEHEFFLFYDRKSSAQSVAGKNVHPVVLFPPARHPFYGFCILKQVHNVRCASTR